MTHDVLHLVTDLDTYDAVQRHGRAITASLLRQSAADDLLDGVYRLAACS